MTIETPEMVEWNGVLIRTGDLGKQDIDVVREVLIEDTYKLWLRYSYGSDEVVFDIGAHIGTFAIAWHRINPTARIICVEACPENIPLLKANVGEFATVIHAACSYEPGELALMNSIKPGGKATGGSVVVSRERIHEQSNSEYWHDLRPLRKITIEEIMTETGVERIDVLKMDCEAGEFSIIDHSTAISSVKFICGEYHGISRWNETRARRFPGWNYGHMFTSGELGIFHLENPDHVRSK